MFGTCFFHNEKICVSGVSYLVRVVEQENKNSGYIQSSYIHCEKSRLTCQIKKYKEIFNKKLSRKYKKYVKCMDNVYKFHLTTYWQVPTRSRSNVLNMYVVTGAFSEMQCSQQIVYKHPFYCMI